MADADLDRQHSGFAGDTRGQEGSGRAHGHKPDRRGSSFWSDAIWVEGSDRKARRLKPGLPLLAHGVPGRVGKLRAYGNAIVAPLAAEVVKALMETLDEA